MPAYIQAESEAPISVAKGGGALGASAPRLKMDKSEQG